MKKLRVFINLAFILASASFISACTTENSAVKIEAASPKPVLLKPAPQPLVESSEIIAERAARASAQSELDSDIALYQNGEYHNAIKRLNADLDSFKPYKELELQALKYSAFSYCLIARAALCRQEFEKAVKLDPSFDLEPGEKGHPLWGPVFARVKKKN